MRTAFSPDGKLMASSGNDGPIHLWYTATWEKVATLSGHSGDVRGLKFSHDGRTLASGGVDQAIHLWDVETKKERSQLQPAGGAGESKMQVLAVAYAPDGNRVATAVGRRADQHLRRPVGQTGPVVARAFRRGRLPGLLSRRQDAWPAAATTRRSSCGGPEGDADPLADRP